jgi:hypothetical protein
MPSPLPEIGGKTIGSAQPVLSGCDWRFDCVRNTNNVYGGRSAHQYLNRRTLTGIQRKVIKQGKRNAVSRFILTKNDKEKIAAWKQDLLRVLHVFNVRPIGPVGHS